MKTKLKNNDADWSYQGKSREQVAGSSEIFAGVIVIMQIIANLK